MILPRKRTLLLSALGISFFAVLLIELATPSYSVIPEWMNPIKTAMVKSSVSKQRNAAEPIADKAFEKRINFLKEHGIIGTGTAIASSKIDACYVTHADGGWMAIDWYQDCYLRHVEGFTTTLDKPDIINILQGTANPFGTYTDYLPCTLYENEPPASSLLFRPTGIQLNEKNSYNCDVPSSLQDFGTVKGPIVLNEELAVKTYRSFNPKTIGNQTNQLWVSMDTHYYHESLGCTGIIFCSNPREKPITAP